MRWKSRKTSKENWHTWFAWYPVKVLNYDSEELEWVWLEKVLRIGRSYVSPGGICWVFTYKNLEEKC